MVFHLFIQDILIDHILIVRYYITTGDIKINDIVLSMEVKKKCTKYCLEKAFPKGKHITFIIKISGIRRIQTTYTRLGRSRFRAVIQTNNIIINK